MKTYKLTHTQDGVTRLISKHPNPLNGAAREITITDSATPPTFEDGVSYALVGEADDYDPETQSLKWQTTPTSYKQVAVDLPPTPVPTEVTNYQLKQALNETPADRQAVEALIAGSNDQNTIDGWQHASTFKATNPLFQGAVVYLGWSQDKVDALLIRASEFD